MNALQRALLEKAGQEQGWECSLSSAEDGVVLGSARHRARARIAQADASHWSVTLPGGVLAEEIQRTFPGIARDGSAFTTSSMNELSRLLRRAAELAQSLPNQAELTYEARVAQTLSDVGPLATEIERLVRQRVGQDTFRQALMDYWGHACAVTGITLPAILRASHAKPWADCTTDSERLDVFNGFLLTANLDALFDRGLITFHDNGQMILASSLPGEIPDKIGLRPSLTLRWITRQHEEYLHWHREHVFDR